MICLGNPAFSRFSAPAAAFVTLMTAGPLGALDYEKDIQPILMNKCADCHSDEAGKSKGGLKFDDPAHFHKRFSKNSAVIPGDWDASYLFVTIFRPPDSKEAMPPKGKGESLNREEVMKVMQWIAEGASINGTRGEKGTMPGDFDALLADMPGHHLAKKGKAKSETSLFPKRATPAEEDWTNTEGKTIKAVLVKVEDGKAHLRMQNGKVYKYPVDKLSKESRERLEGRSDPDMK